MTQQYMEPKPRLSSQTGLCVLAFFIPIAGLIIGLVYQSNTDPATKNTGGAILMWAVIGFLVWIIPTAIIVIGLVGWFVLKPPPAPHPFTLLPTIFIGIITALRSGRLTKI